jgi:hypothetical protein
VVVVGVLERIDAVVDRILVMKSPGVTVVLVDLDAGENEKERFLAALLTGVPVCAAGAPPETELTEPEESALYWILQ